MINKALLIISTFKDGEIKDLTQFIRFYCNRKSKIYLELIKHFAKSIQKDEPIDKHAIFKKLYPNQPYRDVKFRLLQSDLVKVIEKFIAYQSIEKDPLYSEKAVLNYYKNQNLTNLHRKSLLQTSKKLNDQLTQDQLRFSLFLKEEQYELAVQQRKIGKNETNELIEKLDYEYIIRKLRYSCLVASQENIYNINFEHGLKNYVIEYVENNELASDPAIGLYYFCYQMLSQRKGFQEFRKYLSLYRSRFSLDQLKELYTLVINFCIRSLNQGDQTYGRMGLEFYQEGLEKGILLNNGRISRFTFRNIVTMAIRIGEYHQAEAFIAQFKDLIDTPEKKNMVNFTTALVLFSQGKYEDAENEILHINFKDLLFNLATKSLQLKIYYEMKEFWVLKSHLDAMQIFLKRQKSLGYHKQNYLNMITYSRKLMNASTSEKLHKLKDRLLVEKTLIEKRWFLNKVEEKLEQS